MEAELSFGLWLQKRRKALDLTREELAQKAGCSISALRKIESDERRPSKQLAELLANALDVPPDEHSTFIRIARGDLALERLHSLLPLSDLSPLQPPRIFSKLIPIPPTSLIGRETELAALGQMLGDPQCRLITLIGPGGIGKTRLALEVARGQSDSAAFVSLASVDSSSLIVPTIADALGFTFHGAADPKAQLLDYLRDRQMLLVLDNLEHLLDGAGIFAEILQSALRVKMLCTSREPLKLRGEWVFEVGGLNFPKDEDSERGENYSANTLFVQCAQRAKVDLALTAADLSEVTRICTLVEGMPLAIELAAAWLRILSCREIARELERGLDILSMSPRDMPERHHSMQAVFDHSWKLLPDEERRALSRLSVFRGGFTREAAQEVAEASLVVLSSLVSKSLVRLTQAGRYDMHELLRQYTTAHLEADPAASAAARQQHYAFYLALAETADTQLRGPGQLEWLSRLEQEHDNLRAALLWSLDVTSGQPALRLAGTLRWFWYMRAYYTEGCDWLMKALGSHPSRPCTALHARALEGAALLDDHLGNHRAALSMAEEAAAIFGKLGDKLGLAGALTAMGIALEVLGEVHIARTRFEEALSLYREVADRWGTARGLTNLGSWELASGDQAVGRTMVEESVAILDELGDRFMLGHPLFRLGQLAFVLGDYASSRAYIERSVSILRQIRDPEGIASSLTILGQVLQTQGDYAAARACLEEATALYCTWCPGIEVTAFCALVENDIVGGDLPSARMHFMEVGRLTETSENQWLRVRVQLIQGMLAYYEGNPARAAVLLQQSLSILRGLKEKAGLGRVLVALGNVMRAQGEAARAATLLAEGMELFRQTGNKLGLATALEGFAGLALSENAARAARLFGSAEALRALIGAPLPLIDGPGYARDIATIRAQLGEVAFAEAWERGKVEPWNALAMEIMMQFNYTDQNAL